MVTLLVLTLANVAVQVRRVSRRAGIELRVGEKIPFHLRSAAGGLSDFRGSGCSALFLCTPQCAACRELASRLTSAAAKFVLLADDRTARDYAAARSVPPASVWVPDGRRDVRLLGTPTRVIVDGHGRVRHFELSGDELAPDSIARLCSGIAVDARSGDSGSEKVRTVTPWSPLNGRRESTRFGGAESNFDVRGRPATVVDARENAIGPEFGGIRDAILLGTRIVVLEEGTGAKTRLSILRAGVLEAATDSLGRHALSLVAEGKQIGVWRPDSGAVVWFDTSGVRLGSTTFDQVRMSDLTTGYSKPLWPRRSDGRLFHMAGQFYIETRPMLQQRLGPTTDAYLLRTAEFQTDTLLAFRAPSYSVPYGSGRACCLPPKVFASQPAWALFRDGGVAVSPSDDSRLLTFDASGAMVAQIQWSTRSHSASDADRIAHFRAYTLTHLYAGKSAGAKKRELAVFQRNLKQYRIFFGDAIPDNTGLVIDTEDRIWVRRSDATRPFARADVWDVFSRDLRDHAVVQLAGMHDLFAIGPAGALGSLLVNDRERLALVPIPALLVQNRPER